MTHLSEEDLILHYYAESGARHDAAAHLAACPPCAAQLRALASVLDSVHAPEIPERHEHYGLEVWQRIRHTLPERQGGWALSLFDWRWYGVACAATLLLAVGFVTGREWSRSPQESGVAASMPADDAPRRALLMSVADHLERSERLLTEVMNADAGPNSTVQAWAEDLVSASRLYRQDAVDDDEDGVAAVLDELERTLIEIVHSPSRMSRAELENIRTRIESASLLFKVRVLGGELRHRQLEAPASQRPSRSQSPSIG